MDRYEIWLLMLFHRGGRASLLNAININETTVVWCGLMLLRCV